MIAIEAANKLRRRMPALLAGTIMVGAGLGVGAPAFAQAAPVPAPAQQPAPAVAAAPQTPQSQQVIGTIRQIAVVGSQRLEPDTVRSYLKLRPGGTYSRESLDQALKDLFATELFADATIRDDGSGNITIEVRENPVINRIVLEGNKRLKEEKIKPEIRLAPRQIFTRSKVRADVARIIELYRRQGRFAAVVEPKMVQLDQNRVDIIFEITEGDKSKVRQINVLGNQKFSDGELRAQMATKQSRIFRFFSSADTYDPDRLAYDQGKLRQFYLTNGYADFRVTSAIAELTPDKRDFIITYVVEEGDRYKFGEVTAQSDLRDLKPEVVKSQLPMKKGDWYNAKQVEDTVESITETAGLFGYAFADVNPQFNRDPETKTMAITFNVAEAPRVYVERIDINGNTTTQDKVVRREFRLQEGDAFNSFLVKRSQDRINSLGYFQEKFEIKQQPGSAPDRVVLEANLEEKSTGTLQLSAGFSSLERFIVNASVTQSNFRGKGQELRASVNYSSYSKSVELGFTEPYLFDRNIALGGDIFRRDLNQFNFINNSRNTTYQQTTTGFQVRLGVPLTEFIQLQGRYGLSFDDVSLDQNSFFINGQCSPLLAGRFLCDAIGKRTTSSIGYSLVYSNLNNGLRPSKGQRIIFSQDFAGLGGDVKYLRTRAEAAKYWGLGKGFILSVSGEGGYILPLQNAVGPGSDAVRLVDRFYLGSPQIRGFDIRGVGPRVKRFPVDLTDPANPKIITDKRQVTDDAIGGRAYYLAHAEIEIPLSAGAKELGLRPSIFIDAGAVFDVRRPSLIDNTFGSTIPVRDANGNPLYTDAGGNPTTLPTRPDGTANAPQLTPIPPFVEQFFGDSPKPRVSVGFGVNWNSPFGPFRIDIAKALLKEPGDDPKLFTFNVGTQF